MTSFKDSLLRPQASVFALSWLAYASYYIGRKQFAVAKSSIASEYHLGTRELAAIDTGYLLAYSVGMFASGLLCDRIGPRRLVGMGMIASAFAIAVFGGSSSEAWFAIAFTANGLAQSTGWPGTVKAMAPWWPSNRRAHVMGWWCTCYQVGGIAATACATALLVHWGWRAAFFGPSTWLLLVGVLVLFLLPETKASAASPKTPRGSWAVLRQFDVWYMGFVYFGFKLIRYSLLFWLPFYLEKQLHYSRGQAGYLSISFELGGILGTIASGILFARLHSQRRVLLFGMTCGLGLTLALYTHVAAWGAAVNFAAMALVGFMLFGPDALISGAVAQDLGGAESSGATSGVINGVGSVGAIAQGAVTALVAAKYGWDRVFHLFIGLAFVCAAALIPYAFARRGSIAAGAKRREASAMP